MNRGDYVVRFWTTADGRSPGFKAGERRLGSMVFRDVQPVLHSSGALEIIQMEEAVRPREFVVAYGPGAWQSITPADPPHTHRMSGSTVASADLPEGVSVGGGFGSGSMVPGR